jgi:tRNA-dihydrouridine synthase B
MSFTIGPFDFEHPLVLAPMAGITDLPFRMLCRQFGAAHTIAEMTAARMDLTQHRRSRLRNAFEGEPRPHTAQILGNHPYQMAEYARFLEDSGVNIIDINLGCTVPKVRKKLMGAALLQDLNRVAQILEAVSSAVSIPVTVKTRTGVTPNTPTAHAVAHIAQESGLAAITLHGRSASCSWDTPAQYNMIAEIKQAVSLPVIANGDIDSAQKALEVLAYTQADAIMIGRASRGNPLIFKETIEGMSGNPPPEAVAKNEIKGILFSFLEAIHTFYGEREGTAIAKKHIRWFASHLNTDAHLVNDLMKTTLASDQLSLIRHL